MERKQTVQGRVNEDEYRAFLMIAKPQYLSFSATVRWLMSQERSRRWMEVGLVKFYEQSPVADDIGAPYEPR